MKAYIRTLIFFPLGCICLGLGTIGIFLPVLPTTPLYLAAIFSFAKASKRFHAWFENTKLYKKHLKSFLSARSMPMDKAILLLTQVSALLIGVMVTLNIFALYILLPMVIVFKWIYFVFKVKITHAFKASMYSRITAIVFGAGYIAAMILMKNIVIDLVFSVFLILYEIYFIFAKKSTE